MPSKARFTLHYQIKVSSLNEALFKKALQRAKRVLGFKKSLEVSLILISPAGIKKLNQRYRRRNQVTDVLSFSELNEIFICYRQAKIQAKRLNRQVTEEILFLFVHGLLHLLGYNDKTAREARVMDDLTKKILNK